MDCTAAKCYDVENECKDDAHVCSSMSFNGAITRVRCQKSCNLCHCSNFARNCLALLSKCQTSRRVRERCQLTCNTCNTECVDVETAEDDAYNCIRHSDKCEISALFRKRCARTCGLC
uniref:ShKT domain-containing protein n=1 Tax=Syphacia muris TaxID=451379 RepID=A0A0N5AES5_9BILA